MKSGTYTIYNDKEYRIGKTGEDWVNLVSRDENDLQNGFERYDSNPDIFTKKIKKGELGEIYDLTSYGIYKGVRFLILSEDETTFELAGGEKEAKQFPMICHNKGEFYMEVDKIDVELVVRKRPMDIERL